MQSWENKGDSHCHCLHLQLIITSTSKAVACAVISTAGNVTTRPTAQTTTSARALVRPAPPERGKRSRQTTRLRQMELEGRNSREIKGLWGLLMILLSPLSAADINQTPLAWLWKAKGNPAQLPPQLCPFPCMTCSRGGERSVYQIHYRPQLVQ